MDDQAETLRALCPEPDFLTGVSVVVIEDAAEMQIVLRSMLERQGATVSVADDGPAGVELVRRESPTIVMLDIGLPTMDGFAVCREIRVFSDAYLIMLTARGNEIDRVRGLRLGADDYLTKPFSPPELVARIEAVLRRPRSTMQTADEAVPLRLGDLMIDTAGRRVDVAGEETQLTRIEFDLLAALGSRPSTAWSRRDLIEVVWGDGWVGDGHVIDVHIANLRKKIDRSGRAHIDTVRGVGYRLAALSEAS